MNLMEPGTSKHPESESKDDSDIVVLGRLIIELRHQMKLLEDSVAKRFANIEVKLNDVVTNDRLKPKEEVFMGKEKESTEKRFQEIKQSFVTELCGNISVAGLCYIADREAPKQHRMLWIFIHFSAILVSFYLIQDAYNLWQNSPIVQSINNTLTKVETIPFPAVTLCEPLILQNIDEYFDTAEKCIANETKWVCPDEDLAILELTYILLPADEILIDKHYEFKELLEHILPANRTFSSTEYLKHIETLRGKWKRNDKRSKIHSPHSYCVEDTCPETYVSFPFVQGISVCKTYNGVRHGPQYLEIDIKKEYGIGRRLNSTLSRSCKWIPENMFDSDCVTGSVPVYSSHPLAIALHESYININYYDYNLDPHVLGPLLSIDNPSNYPLLEETMKQLPRGRNVHVTLSPKLVTAGEDLSEIAPGKRGCVFSREIKLAWFEFYTQRNCLLECKVNCVLNHCGCVPYYYIPVFNTSLRICGHSRSKECHYITYANFSYSESCHCDCPSDCVFLGYDVDVQDSAREPGKGLVLGIVFKTPEFFSNFRYSVMNASQFVAYSVGIFGLFNGFSLMVVWETMYWFTLRLWVTVNRIPKPASL